MSWYNDYRPQKFSEVIGQDLVKTVLQNAILRDKIKQAYLFSGPKGVGKTTLARIFANELNSISDHPENKVDILEIDAASNTGIDNIRQLIETAQTPPINGKYRIFIIDEIHMLSKNAMNALLKILEEPPKYLIFLLATTNPEKLIPTVLSRVTKLRLSSHSHSQIVQKLSEICQDQNLDFSTQSLELIAKRADGSQRDAINLLETLSGYELAKYEVSETAELLGILNAELLQLTAEAFKNQNVNQELVQQLENSGYSGETVLAQLLDFLLDQKLEGESSYDNIIQALAEILSLKLPVTSVSGFLALLLAKISKSPVVEINHPEPVKKKSETIAEISEINSLSEPKTANLKTDTNISTSAKEENVTSNAEKQFVQISKEKVTELLQKPIISGKIPPMYKMLSGDLKTEEYDEKIIRISTANNVFASQLQSPNLREFLEKLLVENLYFKGKIVIETRTKTQLSENFNEIKNDQTVRKLEKSSSVETQQNHEKKEVLMSEQQSPVRDEAEISSGQIFYQVYKALPEGYDNIHKIPIFSDKIPDPVPAENHDWDSHAESMFDFE